MARGAARAANRQLGQFGISVFGHTELTVMIFLSGHQTIATIAQFLTMPKATFLESTIYQ